MLAADRADATVVRGVLTPALVAGFGQVNWWWPFGRRAEMPVRRAEEQQSVGA